MSGPQVTEMVRGSWNPGAEEMSTSPAQPVGLKEMKDAQQLGSVQLLLVDQASLPRTRVRRPSSELLLHAVPSPPPARS